jgi:DNA polymerase V
MEANLELVDVKSISFKHCSLFKLYNSAIPAGFPSPAQDHREEDIDLAKLLQPRPDSTFIVRIQGNSMAEANIPDGCLAVVDKSVTPTNGAIVVAVLDGEFTVKRFIKQGKSIILQPESQFFQPIVITEEMDFRVWGVVMFVIVDLKK